jgi:tetraacyldisaccharide 4'-kinase
VRLVFKDFVGGNDLRKLIETVLMRAWMRRGWLALLLWPIAQLFRLLIKFRVVLFVLGYKPQVRLSVPVIVAGNIFVGGTGKTPLVIWLAQQLIAAGMRPGIISRGHGANPYESIEVTDESIAADVGDEPLLIRLRTQCPVVVNRSRVSAAKALLRSHSDVDVIISDDGLQHYYLARDIEIVLFDQRGAGNGWLMPAGPLRETVKRHRDFTVVNHSSGQRHGELGNGTEPVIKMRLVPDRIFQLCNSANTRCLNELAGVDEQIRALAGIGNPQRFFDMLATAKVYVEGSVLPDHHVFTEQSFSGIQEPLILITEKDAVKCRQIPALAQDPRVWVVPVSAELDADFAARLLQKLSEKQHGRSPA